MTGSPPHLLVLPIASGLGTPTRPDDDAGGDCDQILKLINTVDPDNQESRRKKGIEEILLQVLCHQIAHTCYISFFVVLLSVFCRQAKLDILTQDFKAGRGNKEKLQR